MSQGLSFSLATVVAEILYAHTSGHPKLSQKKIDAAFQRLNATEVAAVVYAVQNYEKGMDLPEVVKLVTHGYQLALDRA